jgi:hypothetical protein
MIFLARVHLVIFNSYLLISSSIEMQKGPKAVENRQHTLYLGSEDGHQQRQAKLIPASGTCVHTRQHCRDNANLRLRRF